MDVLTGEGRRVHVRAAGTGAPDVLLLHGWVVSSEVWQPVLEQWPAEGAGRLLAVDLRGTGWSHKPATGYAPEDHAADVSDVIDALGLSRVVLVGHSMGGLIAQRVALQRPEAIARLVLVCPVPASGIALDDEQLAFMRAQCGHHDGARTLITMLMAAPVPAPALERLVLAASATSDGALLEALEAWRRARFAAALSAVTVPTAIIATELDGAIPPDLVRATTARDLTHATLEVIPGVGHYPQLEATETLVASLRRQVAASR